MGNVNHLLQLCSTLEIATEGTNRVKKCSCCGKTLVEGLMMYDKDIHLCMSCNTKLNNIKIKGKKYINDIQDINVYIENKKCNDVFQKWYAKWFSNWFINWFGNGINKFFE